MLDNRKRCYIESLYIITTVIIINCSLGKLRQGQDSTILRLHIQLLKEVLSAKGLELSCTLPLFLYTPH